VTDPSVNRKPGLMQHVLIITRLTPQSHQPGLVDALIGVTSEGRSVQISSEPSQRVNVAQLQYQSMPLILLCDQVQHTPMEGIEIPPHALISIIPLPAGEVATMLREGKEGVLLEDIRAQLC